MNALSARPDARPSLEHLGLLYDTPDELVRHAVPRVHDALRHGAAVATYLDRPTTRSLAEALGTASADVAFECPDDRATGQFVRRLAATDRRRGALVLTQYTAFGLPDTDLAHDEAGINVMLADRPMTMVCACPRTASPGRLDTVRRSHPQLVVAGADGRHGTDNPAFRAPDHHSPTSTATWGGRHVLRLRFESTADLQRVRRSVATVAADAGLYGEAVREAVLAIHEAAVLACDEVVAAASVLSPDGRQLCVLDVWAAGQYLVAEVASPRGLAQPGRPATRDLGPALANGANASEAEARLPRDRVRAAGPLHHIRMFCREVAVRDSGVVRIVRVVAGG